MIYQHFAYVFFGKVVPEAKEAGLLQGQTQTDKQQEKERNHRANNSQDWHALVVGQLNLSLTDRQTDI